MSLEARNESVRADALFKTRSSDCAAQVPVLNFKKTASNHNHGVSCQSVAQKNLRSLLRLIQDAMTGGDTPCDDNKLDNSYLSPRADPHPNGVDRLQPTLNATQCNISTPKVYTYNGK
jgi:hypothetical protein